MKKILRILNRIKITGRGTVYTVKNHLQSNVCIGDIFYDLHNNRFRVTEIEAFYQECDRMSADHMLFRMVFDSLDGVETEGNIFLSNLEEINFIFCSHPLYPNRVDEDYEEEFQEAGQKYPCALFSYEDLEWGKLSLRGEKISGLTIYRGWMMKPELYKVFYEKLEEIEIILINTPEEYERYHTLPGWYEDFSEDTAKSVWEQEGSVESALSLTKDLEGSYIVKDFVKSRKHEWYDACFIEDISDKANVKRVISNFVERQDSNLIGGVVLRRFEKLKSIGYHEKSGMPISEEYRVFIFAGRIMIVDDYWQTDQRVTFSGEEQSWIRESVKKIKSNFATMDLARREDGRLIIMEFGDGQVSGLQQITPTDFYDSFLGKCVIM